MDGPYLDLQMMASSGLSLAAGSFALITYGVFPKLRQYEYIKLIMYELLCCTGLALVDVMGPTLVPGSPLCYIQGVGNSYFMVAAAFWIVIVTRKLFNVIFNLKFLMKDHRRYHLFCWGLPLLLACLPFSTNTYGKYKHWGVCWISSTTKSPPWGELGWAVISVYGPLWASILYIIVMLARSRHHINIQRSSLNDAAMIEAIRQSVKVLAVYPCILIFCWSFRTVHTMIDIFSDHEPPVELKIPANCLPLLQGFFVSVALICTNVEFRGYCWKLLTCDFNDDLSSTGNDNKKNEGKTTPNPIRSTKTDVDTRSSGRASFLFLESFKSSSDDSFLADVDDDAHFPRDDSRGISMHQF